jgi:deoxyadenosine/deoxycytidine kinase
MHLAIAGNIGSGKTTLTTLLSKHYKFEPHYENVEDNPYISDFYEDMQRWSFNLQIFFLNERYNSILQMQKAKKNIIQDRTIYEDAHIFAPNLKPTKSFSIL